MASQRALQVLLSPARMAPYMAEAKGNLAQAADLYLWATELAGALHAQISFVELAVRNALDPQLSAWNVSQGGHAEWTNLGAAKGDLYTILRSDIKDARRRGEREAVIRAPSHARYAAAVSHDDMIAQLMFGSWVKILRPMSRAESSAKHQRLWSDQLHRGFPRADPGDAGRVALGDQLDTLRYLRNRVAHHDNLLTVNVLNRLNAMLSALSKIDADYSSLAMARSTIRRLTKEDPRHTW